jgi:hypothetical protein
MASPGPNDAARALAGTSLFLAAAATVILALADDPETRGKAPATVALLLAAPVAIAAGALALQRSARARTANALAAALLCAFVAATYASVGLRYAPAAVFLMFAAALARDRAV